MSYFDLKHGIKGKRKVACTAYEWRGAGMMHPGSLPHVTDYCGTKRISADYRSAIRGCRLVHADFFPWPQNGLLALRPWFRKHRLS